jgi:hypothetical protein
MSESTWETFRRKGQKRFFTTVFISLPILFFTGILLVNNRDLIIHNRKIETDPSLTPAVVSSAAESLGGHDTSPSIIDNPEKKGPAKDTIAHPAVNASEKTPVPKTNSTFKTTEHTELKINTDTLAFVSRKVDSIVSNRPDKLFSEQLPPIDCFIQNRKDIVIRLSLELFFKDEDTRAAIRLHHDAIKIMVRRNVLANELADMKIGKLEAQLYESINSIFEHENIHAIKIRNIQLEKAIQ